MKHILKLMILAVASISLFVATDALAQVDLFGAPRTLTITAPTLTANATAATTSTPVDTHGYLGIAKIDFFTSTNGGGTLTVAFETSPDTTNWTALANFALATSTTVIYTNTMFGNSTNLTATNTYQLPGVITYPTASSSGWATPYIVPAQFTNSGTLTVTASKFYSIGYNISDNARYIHAIWTPTGLATNGAAFGAVLTGRRGGEVR